MLALEQALQIIQSQDTWDVNDDLCDCTYQRVGYWNNPYIGETLEVRLCCVWAEFERQWPQFFRRAQIEPAMWNGETDMPRSLWHRQLAKANGVSVSDARELAAGQDAPRGQARPEPVPFILLIGGSEVTVNLARMRRR